MTKQGQIAIHLDDYHYAVTRLHTNTTTRAIQPIKVLHRQLAPRHDDDLPCISQQQFQHFMGVLFILTIIDILKSCIGTQERTVLSSQRRRHELAEARFVWETI